MAGNALELVSEFLPAGRVSGWVSRRPDCPNGRSLSPAEIQEAGTARRQCWKTGTRMKILFVDLEREWRGGQSQALLTLVGLQRSGQEVLLIAPDAAPLAERAAKAGISVRGVSKFGMRLGASLAIRTLLKQS